jgi:hypothetical protein
MFNILMTAARARGMHSSFCEAIDIMANVVLPGAGKGPRSSSFYQASASSIYDLSIYSLY